jgi:hypothetical protein
MEDEGSRVVQKISNYSPSDTPLRARRLEFSATPL